MCRCACALLPHTRAAWLATGNAWHHEMQARPPFWNATGHVAHSSMLSGAAPCAAQCHAAHNSWCQFAPSLDRSLQTCSRGGRQRCCAAPPLATCLPLPGPLVVADVLTGRVVEVLRYHRETVRDCSWHPCLPLLASGGGRQERGVSGDGWPDGARWSVFDFSASAQVSAIAHAQ